LGITPKKEVNTTLMDTITITFPQVKINLPIKDLTFDSLEGMVFDISQATGRKATEKALSDIDDKLRESRPKGTLKNTGKKPKYFSIRLGDIRYRRTRYIDKTKNNEPRYLLEEHLGLKKNQRVSLAREKIDTLIATVSPYRDTKKNAELLTGSTRSHEAIRQSVIKEAERIIKHQNYSIEKTKRLDDNDENSHASNDIVYVESDSTFIRLQRRRKRKAKPYIVRTNRRRKRRRKSIEVKLGIGYTDKVKRYNKGHGKGLKLKDKFTYASIGSGKTFMERLSLIAEKRLSLSKAKAIIFGGDGGSYITKGIQDYFTGAIYVLCKFHLKRNIKSALPGRANAQSAINDLLKRDKIDKTLSLLSRIIKRTKNRKKKEFVKELHTYISQNKHGINSIKRIENKEIRDKVKGAGAMEPNVDKFLAHRFKKRGMSWSEKGALSLLKIKETIANNEWDDWWSNQRDEKIEINTEPLKQLTAKNFWKKDKNIMPLIEATIPALSGPDRNEPWAKAIRELQAIDYYK